MSLTASSFSSVQNATPEDIAKLNTALAYLSQDSLASSTLQQAAASGATIVIIHPGDDDVDHISPDQKTIYWDPSSAAIVNTPDGSTGVQSAALGLLHEAFHITDPNYQNPSTTAANNADENYAMGLTNIVAQNLGEPQTNDRSQTEIYSGDPVEHTAPPQNGNIGWVTQSSEGQDVSLGAYENGSSPMYAPLQEQAGSGSAQIVFDFSTLRNFVIVPDGFANTVQTTVNESGFPQASRLVYDTVIPVNSDGSADVIGPGGAVFAHFSNASQIQISQAGLSSVTLSAPDSSGGATNVTFTSAVVGESKISLVTTTSLNDTGNIPSPFALIQSTDASASSSNASISTTSLIQGPLGSNILQLNLNDGSGTALLFSNGSNGTSEVAPENWTGGLSVFSIPRERGRSTGYDEEDPPKSHYCVQGEGCA